MIAEKLPKLTTQTDPARHLDALPRRQEAGDSEQVNLLRKQLFSDLDGCGIVPDQQGRLRAAKDVSYPPKELTPDRQIDLAPFERWEAFSGRPLNWLHHKALTRNRLSMIDRLFQLTATPRVTVAEWLEALVAEQEPENSIEASKAAIQTAGRILPEIKIKGRQTWRYCPDGEWRLADD